MFKNGLLFFLVAGCVLSFLGCGKYSFIENKDGQSVFLDERGGKIIYVDTSNRVIEQVDLKTRTVNKSGADKTAAMSGKKWGTTNIPGTDFTVSFSSRFYNNKLLYQIEVEPFDSRTRNFARSVSIVLTDESGFALETIGPSYNWNSLTNNAGEQTGLAIHGSIPITLGNYLEISACRPLWSE